MALDVFQQIAKPLPTVRTARWIAVSLLFVVAFQFPIASGLSLVHAQGSPARSGAGHREPPETGPGWRTREYRNAMRMDNRRGRDVHRTPAHKRFRSLDVDSGTGNSNYLLNIPLLELPGRRMPLSLSLFYNSLLWQQTNSTNFVFDHDHDWPAPGWSLGFGQIYVAGSSAFIIQDADATRHLCVGTARFDTAQSLWIFDGKTNDGTLLDCHITYVFDEVQDQFLKSGHVSYPDGATSDYGTTDPGGSSLFATRITDPNGNYISVEYADKVQSKSFGPRIASITDTLNRVITFNYDSDLPDARLTSIVAPGIGGHARTLVRLHYAHQVLAYAFVGGGGIVRRGDFYGIDAIYFPGNSCGYWFDSYSSYGMITKVSQRCAMTFQPGTSDGDQGTISPGTMTYERVYNYPSVTSGGPALSDAPSYTTMTESWAGMNTPPSVTTYLLQRFPLFQRLIVTYPDGARHYTYTDANPAKFTNGLVYDELTDGGTAAVLSQIQTTYELGDYQSPRVKTIQKTNVLGQTTSTVFTYGSQYNQITRVQELDYDGKTALRSTGIAYVQDAGYAARHIFNLPNDVIIIGQNGTGLAETTYAYDHQRLTEAPSITNHSDSFDPSNPGYDKSTDFRGNITQILRVTNPGNPPFLGLPEDRRYDIAGNLVTSTLSPSQATYTYTLKTDYAYPEAAILASRFACISKCSISQASTYDYGTGLVTSSTDANGRATKFIYDGPSLRRIGTTWSTNATEILSYDDANLTTTDTTYAAGTPPTLAAKTVVKLNGLRLPVKASSLAEGNVWNVVDTEYDARGRIARRSLPYRPNSAQPAWTSFAYDGLGRVTSRQTADGSQFLTSYDGPQQPSSATGSPGETVLSTDAWGREQWYRLDGLGNLAEVIEPNPNGNGTVAAPGNMLTRYSFDALGRLLQVMQGEQVRQFQYDALGNLTAEYLPEKNRSFDVSGHHVTSGGVWSDLFTYDQRSNLISHTDARGVKATFLYSNDPLDRLQGITYDLSGTWDANNPIVAIPNVTFEYVSTGDIRRLKTIRMPQAADPHWCQQDYGYDAEARLSSNTSTCRVGQPLAIDYSYDALDRIIARTYPAEYGTKNLTRRVVSDSIGIGSVRTAMKIDGVPVASQISYDATGQVTSLVFAEGNPQSTTDTFSYDPMSGRLTGQTVQRGAAALLNLGYGYIGNNIAAATGQLTQLIDNLDTKRQRSYIYDALGRLVTVQDSPYWRMAYEYDRYGNRTSTSVSGAAADGSAIPLDGLPLVHYNPATNHISTPGFLYDAAGNVTRSQREDGSWLRYRYDAANHLATVLTDAGVVLESYSYAADGHRLIVNNPGASGRDTYYVWDADNALAEYHIPIVGGKLLWSKSSIYLGNRVLATLQQEASNTSFRHWDRLEVRLITNGLTAISTRQINLPFGTLLPDESSSPVNPIYITFDRSETTGQDYATNRYYDASQGRFSSVDPLENGSSSLLTPQSLNLYSYSLNDPVNKLDPLGLRRACVQVDDEPISCINFLPEFNIDLEFGLRGEGWSQGGSTAEGGRGNKGGDTPSAGTPDAGYIPPSSEPLPPSRPPRITPNDAGAMNIPANGLNIPPIPRAQDVRMPPWLVNPTVLTGSWEMEPWEIPEDPHNPEEAEDPNEIMPRIDVPLPNSIQPGRVPYIPPIPPIP